MDSEGQKQPQDQRQLSAPGAMLAAQREAMGLSIEQIADQLKLAPRQVVAIEQGDYASLPNMAVTRGFIRAYAKVVRLDPQPLVAQIEVTPAVAPAEHVPHKREKITTTFSESRFPTLTERQGKTKGWLVGGVVVLVLAAAGAGAWQAGLISPALFDRSAATDSAAAVPAAPAATAPVQAPNVPLVSTPGQGPATPDNTAPLVTSQPAPDAAAPAATTPAAPAGTPPAPAATTPATAATTPAATTPTTAATTPAATAAPAAAAGANTLVLTTNEDSWIEIRRPGTSPLISRLVKAGSTETFEIDRQATLIVGKPDGVTATLRGAPLPLPKVPNGTISRVQINKQ